MEGADFFCQLMVAKAIRPQCILQPMEEVAHTHLRVVVSNDTHLLVIRNNCLHELTEKLIESTSYLCTSLNWPP